MKNNMPKRVSNFASSLKQLGDLHVNEWDFMAFLNKDIREIEFARSMRRLGNIRVMELDFNTPLPAVNQLANQEVDLISFFKRAANCKVMEWDFRGTPRHEPEAATMGGEEIEELIVRLKSFLQFVVVNLIDEPGHAQIKVQEIAPKVLRFKLILVNRDVTMLIGREGHTASAIRGILKAAAAMSGAQALMLIHSHEKEMAHIYDVPNDPEDRHQLE